MCVMVVPQLHHQAYYTVCDKLYCCSAPQTRPDYMTVVLPTDVA